MQSGWGLSPRDEYRSWQDPHPSPPPQAGEGAHCQCGCVRVSFCRSRASVSALTPRLAAAGGLGFLDRAEPARALGDLHLDLGVPAAARLVEDALAGTVDVALDGAVGRGRDRTGSGGEQDRVCTLRHFRGAEHGGLLVAH
ncbi:hypothetical protein chiPu_0029241, partial [Chiloscyllium punctatum]|nr:hypothetical protein [Chiloscyllium punctatum]